MSHPQHQVIVTKKDATMVVLPADGKRLPKKEAQRLAASVMNSMSDVAARAQVVETQIELNPAKGA